MSTAARQIGEYPAYRSQRHGRTSWSIPEREFRADFERIAYRTLDPVDWRVFESDILHGWDWRTGALHAGLDKGAYFHRLYQVEEILGAEYVERGLYPVGRYMRGKWEHVPVLQSQYQSRKQGVRRRHATATAA